MSVTYLGGLTLGTLFVGFKAVLDPLGAALVAIKASATAALAVVGSVKVGIEVAIDAAGAIEVDVGAFLQAQLSAFDDVRAGVRLAALADIQAQLNACLQLGASLGLTDPTAYLSGLIQGLLQVQANIGALVPQVAFSAQFSANLALTATLQAKIAAFDLLLAGFFGPLVAALSVAIKAAVDALVAITLALQVQVNAAATLLLELQAAIDALTAPLLLYTDLAAQWTLGTVPLYRFDGQLQDLGNEVDAEIAGAPPAGLPLSEPVKAWVVIVPTSAVATATALAQLVKSA